MLLAASIFFGFALLIVLYLVLRHFRKIVSDLEDKLNHVDVNVCSSGKDLSDGMVQNVETVIDGLQDVQKDPLVADFQKDVSVKANAFLSTISQLLENYYILFGISSGLMAMSLVAVVFHFIEHVVSPLEHRVAIFSYAAFFSAFTFGLVKNGFVKRKIQRLVEENKTLKNIHTKEIEGLKASFDELIESKAVQHDKSLQSYKEQLENLSMLHGPDKSPTNTSTDGKLWKRFQIFNRK